MQQLSPEVPSPARRFQPPAPHPRPSAHHGADDDDPSGIVTYAQTGAQFGDGQLWTAIFMLPLQTAVQEACARIGAVTGMGLAAVAVLAAVWQG